MRLSVLPAAFAAALLAACSLSAHAQLLNGSLPLSGIGVTQDGTNLSVSTVITDTSAITTGVGIGDYSVIASGTTFATTSLTLANPTDFSISNATYGSFAASSFNLVTSTASNYDVEIFGIFTPGAGIVGKVATKGELRVSINQSGRSLAEAITLSTPPADTPEPSTLTMLGAFGFSGAGFLVRRKRRA